MIWSIFTGITSGIGVLWLLSIAVRLLPRKFCSHPNPKPFDIGFDEGVYCPDCKQEL